MAGERLHRGEIVFYARPKAKTFAEAVVRCRHPDNTITVEAKGARYRMPRKNLRKHLPKRFIRQTQGESHAV